MGTKQESGENNRTVSKFDIAGDDLVVSNDVIQATNEVGHTDENGTQKWWIIEELRPNVNMFHFDFRIGNGTEQFSDKEMAIMNSSYGISGATKGNDVFSIRLHKGAVFRWNDMIDEILSVAENFRKIKYPELYVKDNCPTE